MPRLTRLSNAPKGSLGGAFPRAARLLARRDFLRVGRRGRRVYLRDLVIIVDRNTLPLTRLGITVSRKAGKAVRRNRAKRLIREYFRTHLGRFAPGFDLVVIVKKAEVLVSLRDVEQRFEHFFRKAAFMDRPRSVGKDSPGAD